ncbi:MAG TPA: DUF5652 family protein [Candidatus Paceibacterota bacterium]|jgi:methionyl-tRNA synthetase
MSGLLFSDISGTSAALGMSPIVLSIIFAALIIWTLTLKGFALWHASRNYQKRWFIVLLVLNTFGVLELIYLLWYRKDKREGGTPSLFNNPEGQPSASA